MQAIVNDSTISTGRTLALSDALSARELTVHYQPIVELEGFRIVGAEALARWPQPDGESIPPAQFVPIAEASGLIVRLGDWVLSSAAKTAIEWGTLVVGGPRLFVNVSPHQLGQRHFVSTVMAILAETGLPSRDLCLELTESGSLTSGSIARDQLQTLRDAGVLVAIDDFGTGYASHEGLRNVGGVDFLKIDRQFVQGLPHRPTERAIVRAIIDLAHDVGALVIAEGIERREEVAELRGLHCDLAQGFHFSRPVPPEHFERVATASAERWSRRGRPEHDSEWSAA